MTSFGQALMMKRAELRVASLTCPLVCAREGAGNHRRFDKVFHENAENYSMTALLFLFSSLRPLRPSLRALRESSLRMPKQGFYLDEVTFSEKLKSII
jgi:hypothetical protein